MDAMKKKQDALNGQVHYSSTIPHRIEALEGEIKVLFEKISVKSEEQDGDL